MIKLAIYHWLHVVSLILLAGFTFQAFANPSSQTRKRIMIITGILNLGVLISGFGMIAVMKIGFPLWIWVKLVCWLALAAMAGLAFRRKQKIPIWKGISVLAILVAAYMVYIHRF